MSGRSLSGEVGEVLARLSVLSEAAASTLSPRTSGGHAGSSAPKGVAEGLNLQTARSDPDRPPSKGESLHGWWRWRFARAFAELAEGRTTEFEVFRLKLLAERDWAERVYHSPDRMALRSGKVNGEDVLIYACPLPTCHETAELGDHDSPPVCRHEHPEITMDIVADGKRAEKAATARVVELYEGVSAAEVAVHEYTTEQAVRKARRDLGRDPDSGRERAPFLDWAEPERRRQIDQYRRRERDRGRAVGAKSIANHFGVSKNTVKRYLVSEPVAA